MNILFRILLAVNATSLLPIIFLVHKGFTLSYFFKNNLWFSDWYNFVSYIIYTIVPILLTWLSIFLTRWLSKDEFNQGGIISLEHANNGFLPSYLGYFFVALSISSWETLGFVYILVLTFTYFSQALYFNPLFLLFKYDFYNIKTKNNTSLFLISRRKYRNPNDVQFPVAYRINSHTFIDTEN